MLSPLPHLAKDSIVDVVAPASASSRSELQGGVRFLKGLGLRPRVSSHIFAKATIFANSDAERFRQLQRALWAEDSDAVWCVRGGYGSIRLLPMLAELKKPKKFKWLLGYSDITTLHAFVNTFWHWPSLHSPQLERMGSDRLRASEKREVLGFLFGQKTEAQHSLTAINKGSRARQVIRSSIVGGNMATLQASIGTPWELKTAGHILFFEDIGERPHRLDRMLTQMSQAGWFDHARAVVFGDMNLTDASDRRLVWNDVIPRFAQSQKIPVLKGLKAGHAKLQRTIPFLTRANLITGHDPQLEIFIRRAGS